MLQRRLLAWYRRNRRDLPWRNTRDPYRIWVSEVMLQQTQIVTALPFYQSFIERFPSVGHLAAAAEPDVLAAWSGLGYYRRARHLHEAARTVVRDHGGSVPKDEAGFGSLPGVGRSTRGAVLSIAFGTALPVLDGNVARVLARMFAKPWSVRNPRGAKALWEVATALVPRRAAGEWNQALMELGATVCTPRNPRCAACPLRASCTAFAAGTVDRYPPVTKREATVRVRRAVVVLERKGQWLLVRRSGAVLDGLWEPPGVEIGTAPARATLRAELRRLGLTGTLTPTAHRVKHRITHHAIEVEVWRGASPSAEWPATSRHVNGRNIADGARVAAGSRSRKVDGADAAAHALPRWIDPHAPDVPLTGLTQKLVRLLAGGHRRAR